MHLSSHKSGFDTEFAKVLCASIQCVANQTILLFQVRGWLGSVCNSAVYVSYDMQLSDMVCTGVLQIRLCCRVLLQRSRNLSSKI